MSLSQDDLVLPRPGHAPLQPQPPISGPSEEAFTATFGTLLPPASHLRTEVGKAAYYEIPPSATPEDGTRHVPERVLFIHGVQTPAIGMLPLARALQSSFPHAHLVLLDLWGHGLSDTPIVPHEAALFHNLVDNLLDHLAWPAAHLVGFSFGGALTVGYVASRPQRVQSYTLVAPAGLIRSAGFSDEERGHLRGGGDEAAVRAWVLSFLEGGPLVVPADWEERVRRGEVVAEAVREWQMREHPGHFASVVAVFRDGGVMDKESVFTEALGTGIPSLVVLGETDTVCTEADFEKLGFANVFVVPQAGHSVVRDRVPEVAGHIERFWGGLETKST